MYSYKAVEMILKRGLDQQVQETQEVLPMMPEHENIRGKNYYK
jgi:hypothetical protein